MNIAVLTGRLTKDPELRTTATGTAVVTFTLAVDRLAKEKATDWIPVTAWGQLATNCDRFLHRGSKVNVKGRIQSRSYEDRQGNKRTAIEVIAEIVDFLDPREAREARPSNPAPPAVAADPAADWETQTLQDIDSGVVDPSDLPF